MTRRFVPAAATMHGSTTGPACGAGTAPGVIT